MSAAAKTPPTLPQVLAILRSHRESLRSRGIRHAAVFGSVARGDARPDSDIDILVDLDPDRPMGVWEYAAATAYVEQLLGGDADVANRSTLKPLIREHILREAIDAF